MFYRTIEDTQKAVKNCWYALPIVNAACISLFTFPFYFGHVAPTPFLLYLMLIGAVIGFLKALYIKYRTTLSSSFGLFIFSYLFVGIELMLGAGGFVLMMSFAGYPESKWLALCAVYFCSIITLFDGMRREAIALGMFNKVAPLKWRSELEKYLDYPSRKVYPALTNGNGLSVPNAPFFSSPYAVIATGLSGIPLLFEWYGGGKFNAIFLASPMISVTAIYLNYKIFGPGIVRIVLLRRLEKSLGYRFINADLERIQELRRTFILSRWLMKDYVKLANKKTASNEAVQRK